MTLRGEERHAYVLELVEKYEKDAEAERESVGEEWLLTRQRTFTGVDVTQLRPSS
ncbi:hypothetical protein M427DRAFT_63631 [Gonapodya prolifera JEL478]|uniref:Uncharacterized protein n=1 Tax=Gonapodya prolifera (strain JEL478) TaxID=1344416 RepID=A0A138ZYZ6_GONPJ|nr:hypothetical protein M427DRAFT_63631 [Gonapodya prolifera JEL478]|eukprot:KXS09729.1 hypothetical protein M427DRAFT_63631 [Gonapodya prolifera JEL478]